MLSTVVGGALDVLLQAKMRTFFKRVPTFEVSFPVLSETGFLFDELWQSAGGAFKIVGDRQSAYIQWRFAEYPESPYRCFFVKREAHSYGYIIFQACENHVSIVDFLADTPGGLKHLFQLFTEEISKKIHVN